MAEQASNAVELDVRPHTADNGAHQPSERPDGGYGWTVVFACFVQTFWVNAWTGCWGILQVALLRDTLQSTSTSTLSFVGSLGLSLTVLLAFGCVWIAGRIGAKWSSLIGVVLFSMSTLVGSFAVQNVGGMFVSGALYGVGGSLMFSMSTSLPVQWFDRRLGTANGIVKLGGGIGATIMALVVQSLIDRVGIAWTFRVLALTSLASGVPAALLIKETTPRASVSVDFSPFRKASFSLLFLAGAIGVFALYIPSFFLPMVATSIGLSSAKVAAVMACYNGCVAFGRLGSGIACDKIGSTNMLLLAMALNAITMLAIWSVASNLAILVTFATLNGIANGAFFVTMPTAIGRLLEPRAAAAGIGMAITGWSIGDLLGNPIAGFLIAATHADHAQSIVPYRAAVFYAGATALVSTILVVSARLKMDLKILKIL